MKKTAIICAPGFEAGETLLVADVLCWGGLSVDLITLHGREVVGMHGITTIADRSFGDDLADYDLLVVPGGTCAKELMEFTPLGELLCRFAADPDKLVAGICSGVKVLHHAGLLSGKRVTYKPIAEHHELFCESTFVDEPVVRDGNLITSRGPGLSFHFAYALVSALGEDAEALKARMQYR